MLNNAHVIQVPVVLKVNGRAVADLFFFYEIVHFGLAYWMKNDVLESQLILDHIQCFEEHFRAAAT